MITAKEYFDAAAIVAAINAGWKLCPSVNKWRHHASSALYVNSPRWGRYACEDHNITVTP